MNNHYTLHVSSGSARRDLDLSFILSPADSKAVNDTWMQFSDTVAQVNDADYASHDCVVTSDAPNCPLDLALTLIRFADALAETYTS